MKIRTNTSVVFIIRLEYNCRLIIDYIQNVVDNWLEGLENIHSDSYSLERFNE